MLELLAAAPDPDTAARLSNARILRRCAGRTAATSRPGPSELRQMLRAEELRQPPAVQAAYAAIVASEAPSSRP